MVDMMRRFPLINSKSEKESEAKCPKSIYESHPSISGDHLIHSLRFIELKLAMLGKFCITVAKDDNTSEGDKWKISNIDLKDCEHEFPRKEKKQLSPGPGSYVV